MRLALAAILWIVATTGVDGDAPAVAPTTSTTVAPTANTAVAPAVSPAVPPLACASTAAAAGRPAPVPRTRCSMDVLHPIEAEVVLVDELVPGQWLRAVVHVHSRLDLADVQVDIDPVGAVELAGPRKTAVVEIAAGSPYERAFDLRVPDTASPQQVHVRISGKAEGQPIERGAVLHLLPRGVAHPGVESAVRSGTQRVLEQRGAARRAP